MKKQNTNPEVQTENTESVKNTTTQATTKKEEKKMTENKKSETATTPEFLTAYRTNDAGEFLMTAEMFDEFKGENASLVFGSRKTDKDVRLVKMVKTDKQPVAIIRIDETAKKKQVHVKTGATKKVESARNEATGIRYKIIFRAKTEKYEVWSADGAGKRKMEKRDADLAVVKAEYDKLLGKAPEAKATTKKSA